MSALSRPPIIGARLGIIQAGAAREPARTEAAAEAVGLPYTRLTSGASHDANHIARLCPIGMLFVARREGRSHCSEEWTDPAELAAGARVLLELALRLDRALGRP